MTATHDLPAPSAMYRALVAKDASFDGVFLAAVRTTRIFCRPSCPARKPARENVEFFATAQEATLAGYRACLRCRPLTPPGGAPEWLAPLLADVERAPDARWTDADLAARGLDPVRVRRWFLRHHAMTFHAFHRSRRVGRALGRLKSGADVLGTALDAEFESLSGFHDAFRKLTGRTPAAGRAVTPLRMTRFATPLGAMVAAATPKGLCLLEFADRRGLETELRDLARRLNCAVVPEADDVLRRAEAELAAYFDGKLRRFTVPLDLQGTPFQRRAWDALSAIPYGATRSYAQQAAAMGAPSAVRAAGRANGMNRVAIVVPCHRVVGADGELTGYGGGLWRKRRLLELERGAAE
jgi:AraC family transcriptional regulator, regulatory protein of adaptative response / methylated-DNA-[protein]-cysteine methyltransferase